MPQTIDIKKQLDELKIQIQKLEKPLDVIIDAYEAEHKRLEEVLKIVADLRKE